MLSYFWPIATPTALTALSCPSCTKYRSINSNLELFTPSTCIAHGKGGITTTIRLYAVMWRNYAGMFGAVFRFASSGCCDRFFAWT